jgi:hypothetical protein
MAADECVASRNGCRTEQKLTLTSFIHVLDGEEYVLYARTDRLDRFSRSREGRASSSGFWRCMGLQIPIYIHMTSDDEVNRIQNFAIIIFSLKSAIVLSLVGIVQSSPS